MDEFSVPIWLLSDDMRDELKWRYVLLRYHCQLHHGVYVGNGESFARDFGIGRYAVETALAPFVARGLLDISVTGAMDYATMADSRIWTIQLRDTGKP